MKWLLASYALFSSLLAAHAATNSNATSRQTPLSSLSSSSSSRTTITPGDGNFFHNSGVHLGADPYALWDEKSGYYYAYSTIAPDPGYYFAVYRSPDLSTWQRMPGGAMEGCSNLNTTAQSGNVCWSSDAQWAPEVYHNERTGWYFLFFTARLQPNLRKDHFRYSGFTDAWKLGVGVSRSPLGPFNEIQSRPIDYYPFDPNNTDINLIMDKQQRAPPRQRITHGVPRGVYAPSIDPNLYFGEDGRIYLYFARNYYRNWRWDSKLQKYLSESEIWGVELNTTWWHDPDAKTMPSIVDAEKDRFKGQGDRLPQNITSYNGTGSLGYPPRKDGFTRIVAYRTQPQAWENDRVNAYNETDGQEVDRRETEGSTTISRKTSTGETRYIVFYSANNLETEAYGVGYATANDPLGPFEKAPDNPVLHYVNGSRDLPGIFGPGHGSVVATRGSPAGSLKARQLAKQAALLSTDNTAEQPDVNGMRKTPEGAELFYVHHAHLDRNDYGADRRLFSSRLSIDSDTLGSNQSSPGETSKPLSIRLTAKDQPLAENTAPITMQVVSDSVACSSPHGHMGIFNTTLAGLQRSAGSKTSNVVVEVAVQSASGALFDIGEATNRLLLSVGDTAVGTVTNASSVTPVYTETTMSGSLAVYRAPPLQRGESFVLAYQRSSLSGTWITLESARVKCP